MYSRVSSMLRGSGRMIQRAATTTGSLPLSKSLLHTLLKRVPVSRRKLASFLAGTRYQPGRLTEFCRKRSLCFRTVAASWSGNPACSIKEVARDSCPSTRLGTYRYSGDDSQSGSGTQANTYSDRTRPQGASSDPREGARHSTSCLQRGTERAIPIKVVGAWSDVTARKQLAETLAAAQERLVHLLSCDIEREPAGVAQLAAAGSSLDRHEIAARPATSASDQRPRKHPCRDRSSNANSLQGQNLAGSLEICANLSKGYFATT